MDSPTRRRRPAVHRFSLRYLLVVPVLLAVLTGCVLFVHGDTNIYMLYSQCHARSRLPWLSRLPVLGGPACFLVSFFGEAVASARAAGLMAAVLSFVAGLLTVSTVEAARICNAPSRLIACPTAPWLVFDLVGGAFVWQLVIIPAFFRRTRDIIAARKQQGGGGGPQPLSGPTDPTFGEAMRHLASPAEAVAIPVAVALGFVLPALLMLLLARPAAVLVWLFFPVWVSLVRRLARRAALMLMARQGWRRRGSHGSSGSSLHLESSRPALLAVYALPVACSVLSHALFIWTLTQPDDRKEMTRSALKFITINIFFVGLTVLYWILVEAGWRVALVMVVASIVLGPGAGVCLGWVYREKTVDLDRTVTVVAVGSRRQSGDADPSEETPLLR
ncbi:hypothetical protein MYCTH_2299980 [Thermothelomyces thermophilus ATCC 42464]|uniref:Uncharacterized protein n=1 Tax=Thermothelomyces thermophilus (strain ATCC 42464 / BCRC 31852 / DSM 1799) TaxID=573729 RepID=G2QA47_THET4|nr:uncharacterized protein MYCTH_2299980 [Thermothelomyces thermophilus ATCC 42464]AEO55795.1 hypothetical protein MYCTH_2299980 [Thermothelomyces thermophilus ATCC 42464]